MLRLAPHRRFPGQAQPGEILIDRGLELRPAARRVDILDAQQEAPLGRLRRARKPNSAECACPRCSNPVGEGAKRVTVPVRWVGEGGMVGPDALPTPNPNRKAFATPMADFFELDGPRFGPASGGKPDSLVILLHGLGADGDDLIGLAPHWRRPCPTRSSSHPMRRSCATWRLMAANGSACRDRSSGIVLAGVQAAAPILNGFIDAELKAHGLSDDRLALVGFSQGTMMSLYVAPRRERPVAGVVGYSGALVGANLLAGDIRSRPPVLLIHGEADQVVPFQAMDAAAKALKALDIPVTTEGRPGLPHSIDEAGLLKGGRFLAQRFGVAASV